MEAAVLTCPRSATYTNVGTPKTPRTHARSSAGVSTVAKCVFRVFLKNRVFAKKWVRLPSVERRSVLVALKTRKSNCQGSAFQLLT